MKGNIQDLLVCFDHLRATMVLLVTGLENRGYVSMSCVEGEAGVAERAGHLLDLEGRAPRLPPRVAMAQPSRWRFA